MTSYNKFACGIDFGTSNSTLAQGFGNLIPLEGDKTALPSAVFYGHTPADAFLIGRAAVNTYVDGAPGRLMRSLKSILNQAIVHEKTPVFKRKISFAEIIAQYLAEIKKRAESKLQHELTHVVMGRPVQFVDNDDAGNQLAENTLGNIARSIGFKNVSFQFEPVAAALEFERTLSSEKIALIADIGGGTSDFSTIRLGGNRNSKDRKSDVLANTGIRIGGTDYDKSLSMAEFMPSFGFGSSLKRADLNVPAAPFLDLSTWANIHNLYEPKFMAQLKAIKFEASKPDLIARLIQLIDDRRCHSLLMEVERSKIELSEADASKADLTWLEKNLTLEVNRAHFEISVAHYAEKLTRTLNACIGQAGLKPTDIDVIFFTGGTSMIPTVRNTIIEVVPHADVVNGDQFGAVGLGLGLEAANRYG